MRPVPAVVLASCLMCASLGLAGDRYDFRRSDAYAGLSKEDRARLERVHRDLMMLWGALDRYADEHDGNPPDTLERLVPHYLAELPTDPFATAVMRAGEAKPEQTPKDGVGYRYRKGSPGNRAWCLSSVGLPEFPYLAARGNIGLYMCKGTWISGITPAGLKVRK